MLLHKTLIWPGSFTLMEIHPTAIISSKSSIGAGACIGPYCVIGDHVEIGQNCRLHHHVSIQGPTKIGKENVFYPYACIGGQTQDLKYAGEPTLLEIGQRNEFREFVTVNRSTKMNEKTMIGSDNHFLAYSHIAHNCTIGNHTIFSNNATLGGHIVVEDFAVLGGLCAVHQFCRIGSHAMIGGCSKIVQDVPPYCTADGNPASVRTINTIGLQRRGFSEEQIRTLRQAHRILYDSNLNTSQALEKLRSEFSQTAEIQHLAEFVRQSKRGIIRSS